MTGSVAGVAATAATGAAGSGFTAWAVQAEIINIAAAARTAWVFVFRIMAFSLI